MKDFKSLKSNSTSQISKLNEALEKLSTKKNYDDDRMWYPKRDKAGNGYAVIRFLPAPPAEDFPWVKTFAHGFQGPGGWFIEECPTTIGRECPCCQKNSELWQTGLESNKAIARNRKRSLSYFANIYVVEDGASPENQGKVFLFRFGQRIFDKIKAAIKPEFPDEQPIDPFDFWKGANFKMKIRNLDGNTNYDKSEFDKPSVLVDDDAKLEEIWQKEYSLVEFTAENKYKTYAELEARMNKVLGNASAQTGNAQDLPVRDYSEKSHEAPTAQKEVVEEVETTPDKVEEEVAIPSVDYFRQLAAQG